ncbi:sialate-O-acetyltransferase [gut metagenome]|uniref:Sialate-O-acetyltransferase n=1 Tax=gut metagenome TaxID=749906 RepID=J9G821_9ZZZZ
MATGFAQNAAQNAAQHFSPYYYQRASLFEALPVEQNDILFVGNSITDGGEWHELFRQSNIKNRGISADTTDGLFDRLAPITQGKPAKIFLLIGINDVARGKTPAEIAEGIARIAHKIKTDTPDTKLYIQSVLPVTPYYNQFPNHTKRWKMVAEINRLVKNFTEKEQLPYVDLYTHFADESGQLKKEYSNDGLHLLGNGYLLWKKILMPYLQ